MSTTWPACRPRLVAEIAEAKKAHGVIEPVTMFIEH
jgi:hypothetical protein